MLDIFLPFCHLSQIYQRLCNNVQIPIWNFEKNYGQMFYFDMPTDSGYQISSKVVSANYKAIW